MLHPLLLVMMMMLVGAVIARDMAHLQKRKRQTTKRLSTSTINDLLMHIILS
jgi:hypothetical protein